MKHLKSSLKDLRHVFDSAITAREIAEPLVSFDEDHDARNVGLLMEERSFDVVGVRIGGVVKGFVLRESLQTGRVGECVISFQDLDIMPESASLVSAFRALRDRPQVFVSLLGQVGGLITAGDLQKAPVRMWLFGLLSLIEMQMLRLIREAYPGDSWVGQLSSGRLAKVRDQHADRALRSMETELSDCLQWADKRTIFLRNSELLRFLGQPDKTAAERLLKRLEELRNDLAHSQDIVTGRWPELADLVVQAESLLERLEGATLGVAGDQG
jgi:hypothetical protein